MNSLHWLPAFRFATPVRPASFALAALSLLACSGGSGGADPIAAFSGTAVNELTASEAGIFCDELIATLDSPELNNALVEASCTFASALGADSATCASARDECIAAGGPAMSMGMGLTESVDKEECTNEAGRLGCSATAGQLRSCFASFGVVLQDLLADISCDLAGDTPALMAAFGQLDQGDEQELPPACAAIEDICGDGPLGVGD